jgi:hypothetical protein
MSAGDLAVTLAALLCAIGFAALIAVLMRVLDSLGALRREVESLRNETRPLLAELRASADEARLAMDVARSDLERFDRVLGSAEAISEAVEGTGWLARRAFSAPVIKAAGLAAGTSRTVKRLRRREVGVELVELPQQRRRRA